MPPDAYGENMIMSDYRWAPNRAALPLVARSRWLDDVLRRFGQTQVHGTETCPGPLFGTGLACLRPKTRGARARGRGRSKDGRRFVEEFIFVEAPDRIDLYLIIARVVVPAVPAATW